MSEYLYGIQPTGRIHIGNYLGGLKLSIEKEATILIANLHAKTTEKVFGKVGEKTILIQATLNKLGVKKYYLQDKKAPDLMWKILCKTPTSDLLKMTQYKDKISKKAGLLTYPCLMAADIILADPDYVIIGEDQLQHMEFYRKTCKRLGIKKVAKNLLTETPRIMSIKDPTKKMSKSLGDEHCIYLGEDCTQKIMKAPTTPEGVKNLKQIAKGFGLEYDEMNNKKSKENLIQAINSLTKT